MKKVYLVLLMILVSGIAHAGMRLIYADPMTASNRTSTWKVDEGEQRVYYSDDGMHVQNPYYSVYRELLQPVMDAGKPLTKKVVRSVLDNAMRLCKSRMGHPQCPSPLPPDDEFTHQSLWLTDIELPDEYTIKYKIRIDSPVATLVSFFSSSMKNGDDVLDYERAGDYIEYKGDYMKNYLISWGNRYDEIDLTTTLYQVGHEEPVDRRMDVQPHWSNETYGIWLEWEFVKTYEGVKLYISSLDDSHPLELVVQGDHPDEFSWNGGRLGLRGMDVAAWTVRDLRIYQHD